MYNLEKLNLAKKLIVVVAGVFLLLIGFLIGTSVASKTVKTEQPIIKEVKKEKATKALKTKNVKDFLIAYYTKKDLGENKNRYEPLVTTSMFQELQTEEESPVNQAYKGYIVNQVFEKADIYVDTENLAAIAIVTYKNTQRTTKGTDENALVNQTHHEAIKLTFLKQGKNYLVNRFAYVALSEPLSDPQNTYRAVESTVGIQNVPLEEEETADTEASSTKKEEAATDESTSGE